MAKIEGDLGVKDLETQNSYLMKFVDKIHHPTPLPWKDWVLWDLHYDLGSGFRDSTFLSLIIGEELMRYRSMTRVSVQNGWSTSLWFDDWHDHGPLFLAFSAIFSHVTRPHISIFDALTPSLQLHLHVCLTHAARAELSSVLAILNAVLLDQSPDKRFMI